ncbi:hypothetical protein AB0436_06140 [Streptomyces sp. NPDC051322]|uniref:DUF1990 family protein n=1 Tax=Streptomyces sp. NPDC051322 TaxID=3154645 RepID=UPI00344D5047
MRAPRTAQPRRPPFARRAGTLLRFPLGLTLVTWRYVWRVTALHRCEEDGDSGDLPPPLPAEQVDECVQRLMDGSGRLLHRRFMVRIEGARMEPEMLMERIARDFNRAAPFGAAVFHKTVGPDASARPGDEYRVQMPGPWDGPVRVVHRDAVSLRLATLRGHLEAGQIEFRATAEGEFLCFQVEAWARAGDRFAELLYGRLRISKEIQFNMWVHFCLQAAAIAGGRPRGGVSIVTRSVSSELCAGAQGC